MKYRNINTWEVWTAEEIRTAYEQFKSESSKTLDEIMQDFEEIK